MKGEAIFVLSDNRSGSTLVDQLLGAHPEICSVGELHWLDAYARQDRTIYDPVHPLVCMCGKTLDECSFWQSVRTRLGASLDSFRVRLRAFESFKAQHGLRARLRRLPSRVLRRWPASFKYAIVQSIYGGRKLARDTWALLDAVLDVSRTRYVVDSSKSPFRFRATRDLHPDRVKVILLARDYRAVVYSKMKRGASLEAAALSWRNTMLSIDALTADLPHGCRWQLRYEDLCKDPQRELTRLCEFLGLDFTPAMLERPTKDIHHLGGSPSKFDPARATISLDTAHEKTPFDPGALAELRHLVGDSADMWGY